MQRYFATCRRFFSEVRPCPHLDEAEALSAVQDLLDIGETIPDDLWEEASEVCKDCSDYVADYRA
jgi:hypothetical protein